ncbi:SsrA-binding protein SmpB [Candidatus Uhrbacteria bacterium]|nr:SsrA-binding protein SmpB [Candidatus Uhrbacteria bacterium]MBD3284056.1 SsrA-binding protein SmpB [Candidatus Uhrbacteria bacterium]
MIFAENRKARHHYETLEEYEAGLVLSGQEVKSIREGGANLTGSHISIENGELWVKGMRIAPYSKSGQTEGYDPEHPRKLLMRKTEIKQIWGKTQQKGLTLIPFSLYPLGRHIKLKFGLCRGKKAHDKRESLRRRDIERDVRRNLE